MYENLSKNLYFCTQCVKMYLEVNFELQEQIITSYLADMNKYTENSEGIKNSQIYNSIPKPEIL